MSANGKYKRERPKDKMIHGVDPTYVLVQWSNTALKVKAKMNADNALRSVRSIAYMCTVGAMVLVNAFLPPVHLKSLIVIHWEVLTATCAFVEPIIIFILPGLCYYKMSIKDQLE